MTLCGFIAVDLQTGTGTWRWGNRPIVIGRVYTVFGANNLSAKNACLEPTAPNRKQQCQSEVEGH